MSPKHQADHRRRSRLSGLSSSMDRGRRSEAELRASRRERRASWLSAAVLLGPLALLGELLITRTNHRPLGAATYASVAVVLWVGFELLARGALRAEEEVDEELKKSAKQGTTTADALLGRRIQRVRQVLWALGLVMSAFVFVRALL